MLRLSYRGKTRQKSVMMPGWALGLMAAGSAALGIAIFLVVSTIAVLLLPFVLLAGGITAFLMRKRIERLLAMVPRAMPPEMQRARAQGRTNPKARPDVVDAEYRVVDEPPRRS